MTENTENPRRYVTGEDSEDDFLKLVVDSSPDIRASVARDQKVFDEITGMVKPIAPITFKNDFDEAYIVRQYLKSFALGLLVWTALGFVARILIRILDAKSDSE